MQPDVRLIKLDTHCDRLRNRVGILLSRYVTGQIPMYNRLGSTSPVVQPGSMDIFRCTTGQDQLAPLHNRTAPDAQPVRINYPVAQPDNLEVSRCITGQAPLCDRIGLRAVES